MNGHPWLLVFLNHLAGGLRKMGRKLDVDHREAGQ